jgi:hypothetical protein
MGLLLMDTPDIHPGDRVQMRKIHPCGSDEWTIYRVGADIGMRCTGCQRQVMLPRSVFFKRLKRVISRSTDNPGGQAR